MSTFLTEDFLLQTETARRLYHDHAAKMPIYDYHCHVPVRQIAGDHNFRNITQAWLAGDHYKWRAMRADGVDESYITGGADDAEKFHKWASTLPNAIRNPLYHWTALELKRFFDIDKPLNGDTADWIYQACSRMLQTPDFSVRNLMRKMNVKLVCTTEGPLDDLEHHRQIRSEGFEIAVNTAMRPDKALAVGGIEALNEFIDAMEAVCDISIDTYDDYIEALAGRHDYFHQNGCRLSDYGLERAFAADFTEAEIERIFSRIRGGGRLDSTERLKFNSATMLHLAVMDAEAGWVMQLHLGALRNANSGMIAKLGPDTGYDSIGDLPQAAPLAAFLDRLDRLGKLPRTILYNLNPADNAVFAAMTGNFQDGSCPGKIQWGSGWWFLDQKRGMEAQLNTLSDLGLLSRFVGMLTDSRSFLSYPRHEYFRRILCNLLGTDVQQGLLPNDTAYLGSVVEDICYNNARSYFGMEVSSGSP